MADGAVVVEAYFTKYNALPRRPHELIAFSKKHNDLPSLNFGAAKNAINNAKENGISKSSKKSTSNDNQSNDNNNNESNDQTTSSSTPSTTVNNNDKSNITPHHGFKPLPKTPPATKQNELVSESEQNIAIYQQQIYGNAQPQMKITKKLSMDDSPNTGNNEKEQRERKLKEKKEKERAEREERQKRQKELREKQEKERKEREQKELENKQRIQKQRELFEKRERDRKEREEKEKQSKQEKQEREKKLNQQKQQKEQERIKKQKEAEAAAAKLKKERAERAQKQKLEEQERQKQQQQQQQQQQSLNNTNGGNDDGYDYDANNASSAAAMRKKQQEEEDELLFKQMRERKKRAEIEKKEKAKNDAIKQKQYETKKAGVDKNNDDIKKMMADMSSWNRKNGKVANSASKFEHKKQANSSSSSSASNKKGKKFSTASGPKKSSYSDSEVQNEMKLAFGKDLHKIKMVKLDKYDGDIPLVLYLLGKRLEEIGIYDTPKMFDPSEMIKQAKNKNMRHMLYAYNIYVFFSKLPRPLLSSISNDILNKALSKDVMKNVIDLMDEPYASILCYLWDILSKVAGNQHKTRMNGQSLGKVFGPMVTMVTKQDAMGNQISMNVLAASRMMAFFRRGIEWRMELMGYNLDDFD